VLRGAGPREPGAPSKIFVLLGRLTVTGPAEADSFPCVAAVLLMTCHKVLFERGTVSKDSRMSGQWGSAVDVSSEACQQDAAPWCIIADAQGSRVQGCEHRVRLKRKQMQPT
jgi:hypothetical protein